MMLNGLLIFRIKIHSEDLRANFVTVGIRIYVLLQFHEKGISRLEKMIGHLSDIEIHIEHGLS